MGRYMKLRKNVALALSCTMLAAATISIAACSKKEGDNKSTEIGSNGSNSTLVVPNEEIEYVDNGSTWFNYKKLKVASPDSEKYVSSYIGGTFVKTSSGYAFTYTANDINGKYVTLVMEIDEEGNLINSVELNPEIFGADSSNSEIYPISITSNNGDILIDISLYGYNSNTGNYFDESYVYNAGTKEITDVKYLVPNNKDSGYVQSAGITENGFEYVIFYDYSGDFEQYIYFGKDGNKLGSVKVNDCIDGYINDVSYEETDGDIVSFSCEMDYSSKVLCVDTSDFSAYVKSNDSEMSYYDSVCDEDGNEYFISMDGVYCNGDMYMSFDSTFCNPSKLKTSRIIDASDGKITLLSVDYRTNDTDARLYVFEKAESNPNIGKKVLTLGYIGGLDSVFGEAISQYNEQSDDVLILTKSYEKEMSYDEWESMMDLSLDEMNDYNINESGAIATELVMDILNGEGPDIIVNTMEYTQLDNDDFMIDLASFVDNELGDAQLFDNVLEASKSGDGLYQIPLSFSVEGIVADKKDVTCDKGFTFEEFKDYVDGPCNGRNPIAEYYTRMEVLSLLLKSTSDCYYNGNDSVDFTNDSFYKLAEYCKDYIPEYIVYDDSDSTGYVGYDTPGYDGTFNVFESINDYFYAKASVPNFGFYGLPSFDGRGPAIVVGNSIGICASCSNIDSAKDFIRFIMTNDSMLDYTWNNSISMTATKNGAFEILKEHNRICKAESLNASPAEMHSWGLQEFDESVVDEYMNILMSASTVCAFDPSIHIIVNEEIQSYFVGQKTIEEVAGIIESRAQLVLDEKG